MQLLGRHRAIHLTPPMLWIFRFMTLARAVLFPRQRCAAPGVSSKTARRLEAISRKFPLAPAPVTKLGGQVRGQQNPSPAWLLALLELQRRELSLAACRGRARYRAPPQ